MRGEERRGRRRGREEERKGCKIRERSFRHDDDRAE